MQETIDGILSFLTKATADTLLGALGAVAILLIGLVLIRWLIRLIRSSLQKTKLDQGVVSFTLSFASIALKVLLFAAIAIQLGVPSTSFVAVLGSAGLAVGLALQGSLANLAGGVMLLLFHPFRVGHYIRAGADEGVVRELGLFYTTLQTLDGRTVVLPNGALSNGPITNVTQAPARRIDIPLTLPLDADFEQASRIALDIARAHPAVLADPGLEARVSDIRDGALVMVVRAWANQADWWATKLDLTERILSALRLAGIRLTPPVARIRLEGDEPR